MSDDSYRMTGDCGCSTCVAIAAGGGMPARVYGPSPLEHIPRAWLALREGEVGCKPCTDRYGFTVAAARCLCPRPGVPPLAAYDLTGWAKVVCFTCGATPCKCEREQAPTEIEEGLIPFVRWTLSNFGAAAAPAPPLRSAPAPALCALPKDEVLRDAVAAGLLPREVLPPAAMAEDTARTDTKEERVRQAFAMLTREEKAFLYVLLQDVEHLTRERADKVLRDARWRE